jgi:hypothetical protein
VFISLNFGTMTHGFWTNDSKLLETTEKTMEPAKHETTSPTKSYTFELPFDNDLDQDELNSKLHKPGEAGRGAPSRATPDANPQPAGPRGEAASDSGLNSH